MDVNNTNSVVDNLRRLPTLGVVAALVFVALSARAVVVGQWKLLGIGWFACVAMLGGGWLGARMRTDRPATLVWGYGLASGAMITSASVFLVPTAIQNHPQFGGFGLALGLLSGFGAHTIGHRLAHLDLPLDRTAAEITAHALSAGAIIGIIYGNMPALGPLLGLSIVSHKGPAGYAAAHRLVRNDRSWLILLLPAVGVGIAALVASLLQIPGSDAVDGLVFGFAAGVFLHVAMDFLPRCETGSEIHDVLSTDGHAHELLDRLRFHAVGSTAVGALVVFVLWFVIQ